MTPRERILPLAALLGVAAYVGAAILRSDAPRVHGDTLFVVAGFLFGLTVGAGLALDTARQVARHPALMAPMGIYLGLTWLMDNMTVHIPSLQQGPTIPWVGAVVSVHLLAAIAASAFCYGWQARAILLFTSGRGQITGQTAMAETFALGWRGFARTLGVLSITLVVMLAALAMAMAFRAMMLVAVAALALMALVWNGISATLLLRVLDSEEPFGDTARRAMSTAWSQRSIWMVPTFVPLLVLGIVTFVAIGGRSDLRTEFLWVGGFQAESQWFEAWVRVTEQPQPAVEALLLCAGIYMIVAAKTRIAAGLQA